MALLTSRIDDLTGEPDAQTVVVTVNGKGVEVDLARKSLDRLVKALEPFWTVGSEDDYLVTRRERGARSSNGYALPDRSERDAIRQWAETNGVTVPTRGRLPREVVEQYRRR
jgi:hypothetical protein